MLWTLLTAITSITIFTIAVITAKHAKTGLDGYVVAIIIGSSLAIGNAWAFYKLGDILANLTSSYSETQQEWLGRAFCLFALLWALVAAILTNLVTSMVMRLVS